MIGGTWHCHVCGEERPDPAISVYKRAPVIDGRRIEQRVRYCNDRSECAAAAPAVTFMPNLEPECRPPAPPRS